MTSFAVPFITLTVDETDNTFCLKLNRNDEELWRGQLPGCALPVTAPAASPERMRMEKTEDTLSLRYALPGISAEVVTRFKFGQNGITFSTRYVADAAHTLERVQVFAPGSRAKMYQVVNFRNIHHLPNTYYPTPLSGDSRNVVRPDGTIDTTGGLNQATDSTDIQFAPHPSAMVFTKMDDQLVIACLGLPQGYGLRLRSNKPYVISAFDFIVGNGTFQIRAGETVETPTFFIGYRYHSDPHEGYKLYTRELVSRGEVTPLDNQDAPDWWFSPYYGTWGDQVYFASTPGEGMNWGGGDTMGTGKKAVEVKKTPQNIFREELVDRALRIIKEERLPVGIIGVDDGWQNAYGDWEPHPERVRDMRALVERIHDAGVKAALWWVPFDVAPDAKLLHAHPEWFTPSAAPIAGKYRNVWNQPFLDYSNPQIQEEYLFPLLQRIFGNGPDDWNYDGLKLDFNAMKIFPDMTFHDRDWHGEECYLYRATRLIYEKIKEIRPDAWIMGCTAHPYFSMAQDFCRMYDIHNSDYRAHRERGRMVGALTVGNYLTYDFHFSRERFEGYLRQCQEDGVASQIGSLIGFPDGSTPVDASDFELMRRYLVPGLRRTT